MMTRRLTLTILSVLLLLWAVGCSDNPVDDNPAINESIDENFGGFTPTPEVPGFGDTELLATEGDEEEYSDPMLASPDVHPLISRLDVQMFHLRAVWGRLEYDSLSTTPTDWTGSVSVNRGVVITRRLIRFEAEQDYLVERTERGLIEWVSETTVHNDGIAIDLLVPPVRPIIDTSWIVDSGSGDSTMVVDTLPVEDLMLTFATGPFTVSLSLSEIAALDRVIELPDGNSVSLRGYHFERHVCPKGMLVGHWGLNDEGEGKFRGLWFSRQAQLIGYVHGDYGTNDEGQKVFFGKWIDEAGRFEGLLRGRWGFATATGDAVDGDRKGLGWFAGAIFNDSEMEIGKLNGRFVSAPRLNGGWFGGRWKVNCNGERPTDNRGRLLDDGMADNDMGGMGGMGGRM